LADLQRTVYPHSGHLSAEGRVQLSLSSFRGRYMSSELQLDVCHLNRWRHHLVNAYEVKAGMMFIAGKTVWSMPERFKVVCIPCKALYKCSALPLLYL